MGAGRGADVPHAGQQVSVTIGNPFLRFSRDSRKSRGARVRDRAEDGPTSRHAAQPQLRASEGGVRRIPKTARRLADLVEVGSGPELYPCDLERHA